MAVRTYKQAVVAGCARGIGLALVRQLASEGTPVLALDRYLSPELEACSREYDHVTASIADITDRSALESAASTVHVVDLILCVAGIMGSHAPLLDRPESEPDAVEDVLASFKVNVLGPLEVVRAFNARISRGTTIMFMSSTLGSMETVKLFPGKPAYSISKAGLNMLGRRLSSELEDRGVNVVLMSPGVVKTQMNGWEGDITPEQSAEGILRELAKPDINGRFLRYDGKGWPW